MHASNSDFILKTDFVLLYYCILNLDVNQVSSILNITMSQFKQLFGKMQGSMPSGAGKGSFGVVGLAVAGIAVVSGLNSSLYNGEIELFFLTISRGWSPRSPIQ